jgi:hypothetical protein
MFHAAVKGKVSARRIDPCNLIFDFYCIVADPSLGSNEKIDATARGGPEGMRRYRPGASLTEQTGSIADTVQ